MNKFFVGYMLMFFVFSIVQLLITFSEVLELFSSNIFEPVQQDFPDHGTDFAHQKLWIFWNLTRPLFLFGIIVATLVFAGQVYPLEEIIGWKKGYVSRFLIFISILIIPIYIPSVTYSIYTPIIIGADMLGLIITFLINLGVSMKLIFKSVGEIRRRSLMLLIGFILLMAGFIWALEVGWAQALYGNWGHKEDIIFGSIIQMIAVVFYRKGFKKENIS